VELTTREQILPATQPSRGESRGSDPETRNRGDRGSGFSGDDVVPGTPFSYKEVIFEALKEWLEENQVGHILMQDSCKCETI